MSDAREPRGYGTIAGVFTPTLLTILGVIMYLRTGWVVGNAGLGGALMIILLAFGITAATALSMSSVTTNVRIGAGGAYAIIARSLGIEVGGSIGVPLYLSQTLAVAMYIFGFREGWLSIFPDHAPLLIDFATFAAVFGIAWVSAALAFKTQYVIMALIVGSLVSIAVAAFSGSMTESITWFGEFPGEAPALSGTSFWVVFAVFFPAATGIMAGANLSGELDDPRRSIPVGTLAAVGVSLIVYLLVAVWLAKSATPDELTSNFNVMIDKAAWGPAVVAGLLGATFSSALSSSVGAPRVLAALGSARIFPGGSKVAKLSNGEPRRAMVVSGVIVLAALLLRDLNAIAPLITMFFLITYAMLNVVVLVEKRLGLVSFRPSLQVPIIVPLVGTVGCIFAMFIVNPVFSLVAVGVVLLFYFYLVRRHLASNTGDVRSGLFVALSEWFAKRVDTRPASEDRAWKPDLLVPVSDVRELQGTFQFIRALAHPKGSVKMLGFADEGPDRLDSQRIDRINSALSDEGVFASWTSVNRSDLGKAFVTSMEALGSAFFRPNLVFLTSATTEERREDIRTIVGSARASGMGVALYADHPQARTGRRQSINVWFPRGEIGTTDPDGEVGEMDLALLLAYRINQNWEGRVRLLSIADAADKDGAISFLRRVAELSRLPDTEVYAPAPADDVMRRVPQADLSIFVMTAELDFDEIAEAVEVTGSACLFCRDGGTESALV